GRWPGAEGGGKPAAKVVAISPPRNCRRSWPCLLCMVSLRCGDSSCGGVTGQAIGGARRFRPAIRIAITTAARRAHDYPVVRLDPMRTLARKRASAVQGKLARCPPASAGAAARRVRDAIEGGEQSERRTVERSDLHVLAEPAARGPLAARTRAQLAPPEHERRRRFDDLDRRPAHGTGK